MTSGSSRDLIRVATKNRQRIGYRRIVQLLVYLVIVPTVMILGVGIVLMFLGERYNLVFGILTVAFVSAVGTGVVLVLVFVRREANLSALQADFVSKVSHELRTPLTAIRLFAETIERAPDEKTRHECVERLITESDRLGARIERLLDWGRMEAGRKVYDLREEKLQPIVAETAEHFRGMVAARDVVFEAVCDEDVPPVLVDRHAIVDLLLNLLTNAQKYGGTPPRVKLSALKSLWGQAVLDVTDNGGGIPRGEHRRIFEKFLSNRRPPLSLAGGLRARARDREAHRPRAPGSDRGRQRARAGEQVSGPLAALVAARIGEYGGARLMVNRFRAAGGGNVGIGAGGNGSGANAGEGAARRTVLVVEDDASIALGLRINLEGRGYRVLVAEDGERGLELARGDAPDLIVLDVMLPQMNGFEVLQELRSGGYMMPIIILSARTGEMDKVTGLELGAEDYVAKPFSLAELLARVRAALRRPPVIARGVEPAPAISAVVRFGDVEMDVDARTVLRAGAPVEITATEFDVLMCLIGNARARPPARRDLPARLGPEPPRHPAHDRQLHPAAAGEARAGPGEAEALPHRARGRLPLRRAVAPPELTPLLPAASCTVATRAPGRRPTRRAPPERRAHARNEQAENG